MASASLEAVLDFGDEDDVAPLPAAFASDLAVLQEELTARVAEETNKNLYIVSLFTALLLPPTLITGIFGMNVAGLPGLQDETAFWWVMLGLAAVSGLALLILYLRRLL